MFTFCKSNPTPISPFKTYVIQSTIFLVVYKKLVRGGVHRKKIQMQLVYGGGEMGGPILKKFWAPDSTWEYWLKREGLKSEPYEQNSHVLYKMFCSL